MAFLRLILLSFIAVSCIDNSPRPKSPGELISGTDEFGKTYQVDEIEIEIGTVTPHRCVTDNFITYFPNGNYEINEGATKCEPHDPPGTIGQWYMDRSEERLIVEIGDSLQVWEVDEIDDQTHRITSSFKEGHRTYTFTLSR
ncbi:hypothetical protein SAMN05421640_3050 [Ekhidna lutea]|uniref:Lipocalin-like domain-containing protein n=1 Tax=Ekhidna lutea TaxID=447679 RepID=A0A239LAL6_EKHLU|nr:hypothetical protein [Ekhidna lutea]SNT26699.1 hypothetical protein SAMN05421640_3050 [Ekhidna lutea]